MNNYFPKHYLELSYILFYHQVNARDFIQYFHLSEYEYKNDIRCLKEMQSTFGVKISQYKELLSYQVTDESLFERKRRPCSKFFLRHRNHPQIPKDQITKCIISHFLLYSKDAVNSVQLADYFNYSRSNIRHPLKWSREFLYGYNIETKDVPYYGIKTIGNEFYKRLCLISINSFFDLRLLVPEDSQFCFSDCDSELMERIVSAITLLDQDQVISFTSSSMDFIYKYLLLQAHRIKLEFYMEILPDIDTELLTKTYDYYIAQHIMQFLYPSLDNSLAETLALAILFILRKEYRSHKLAGFINFTDYFAARSSDLYLILTNTISQTYHITITDDKYCHALTDALTRLIIKEHFHILLMKRFNLVGRSYALSRNPLMAQIGYTINSVLNEYFNCMIPSSHLSELIDVMQRYIQSQPLNYPRKNIGIVTTINMIDGVLIKDYIKSQISPDLYNNIEIICKPPASDFIFNDNYLYIADYLAPDQSNGCIYLLDDYNNDLYSLPYFLRINRDLCSPHISRILTDSLSCESETDLNEYIRLKFHLQCPNIFLCNKTAFYFVPSEEKRKAEISLYHLTHSIICTTDKRSCKKVIILQCCLSNENIRLIECIMKMLANSSTLFDILFSNPDIATLNGYINTLL